MNYWLWIIPINSKGLEDLWDFCLREGVAAMQYEIGIDAKAEHNRALAGQMQVGDKIVAYLNENRIGGVGTVTRPFFDGPTPFRADAEFPYGQRVGVDWLATEDGYIDIRMLPQALEKREKLVLMSQTIHAVDQATFEEIEAAVKIARENPLPGIADLLESVPLTDVACREAGPWREGVFPITRPFLEYVARVIQATMQLRQDQDVTIGFKGQPRDVKRRANTRDSASFSALDLPFGFHAQCGWVHGFEESFVWGAQSWGPQERAETYKPLLDRIRTEDETVICEPAVNFTAVDYGIFKRLTSEELRQAHPVELAHGIATDLASLFKRLSEKIPRNDKEEPESMGDIGDFIAFVHDRGFHFPPHLVTSYYLSLQTKPFVILTGISGTGKTKLAQLFAEWMSPPIEHTVVETVETELGDDTFTLIVRPYMLRHLKAVIPIDAWDYVPELDVGERTRVRVRVGTGEEECLLVRYSKPGNPSHVPIHLHFRGAVATWVRNELKIGDVIEVQRTGPTDDRVFVLRKQMISVPRRVTVSQHTSALISVCPDWTDNRGLLGFYNLITHTYQTTDFLRLLMQTTMAPSVPHFVTLDEMNLAKVEYYFADFLSVLESRYLDDGELKQAPLRLHDLPRCVLAQGDVGWGSDEELDDTTPSACLVRCAGCPLRHGVSADEWSRGASDYAEASSAGFNPAHYVPPRLIVPPNVYFSGTVNVDETTYMFSPKVLDRANTIEFNEVDLAGYFASRSDSAGAGPADGDVRDAFTFGGRFLRLPKALPLRTDETLTVYREALRALNRRLEPYNKHFGYRVVDEILLYLWNARELNNPAFGLDEAFDHQICQKVLPKFHGSQAKLQEPLEALLEFCLGTGVDRQFLETLRSKSAQDLQEAGVRYPYATRKILRMLDALEKEGFASFA